MDAQQETPPLAGMRWQVLRALCDLAAGAMLIVQTDAATAKARVVIFDGQALPELIGSVLLKRNWVQPWHAHWMKNSTLYRLSPLGAEALETGLRWWRGLPRFQRMVLRFAE